MTRTKIIGLFFPLLKWKHTKTVWGKAHLILNTLAAVWLYSILFYFIYANISYKKQRYKQLTIYTHSDDRTIDIKQQINFLKNDPLYEKPSNIRVYFVHDKNLFTWLLSPATFVNYVINFINSSNLVTRGVTFNSMIFFNSEIQGNNLISDDITHELVHVLQSKKYGVFASIFTTPGWVNEGYATYRTHIFNKQSIDDMLINNNYKFFAKLIKHAIENMGVSADDLHRGKIRYEDILHSFCQIQELKQCLIGDQRASN
jgi:hypothetical protein